MDFVNFFIGVLLIVLGILLIIYYEDYIKNKRGLVFKIKIGAIGLIMIGIALIIRELKVLF